VVSSFHNFDFAPGKDFVRKNHTGGDSNLGERTRLACSQRRLVVDIVFMFDARARRTAAGRLPLPISNLTPVATA